MRYAHKYRDEGMQHHAPKYRSRWIFPTEAVILQDFFLVNRTLPPRPFSYYFYALYSCTEKTP